MLSAGNLSSGSPFFPLRRPSPPAVPSLHPPTWGGLQGVTLTMGSHVSSNSLCSDLSVLLLGCWSVGLSCCAVGLLGCWALAFLCCLPPFCTVTVLPCSSNFSATLCISILSILLLYDNLLALRSLLVSGGFIEPSFCCASLLLRVNGRGFLPSSSGFSCISLLSHSVSSIPSFALSLLPPPGPEGPCSSPLRWCVHSA